MTIVSIILPTYNRAYVLNQAIDSVLAQSYEDWELIIVDDGSSDNTREVVLPYLTDSRIKYIFQENGRQAKARNRGVQESSGEIIMYLDSDDVYFSEAVERVVQAFSKNKNALFGVGNQRRRIMLVDSNHTILSEIEPTVAATGTVTLQDMYHWNVKFCGSSIFHTREVWEQGVIWDTSFSYFEDWHFLLTLGNKFPGGFIFIPELICEYRLCFGADGINAESSYQDLADGFEKVYLAHKDDSLMNGQQWYPERVEKYTLWQKEVEAGTRPSATYKYFGEYFEKQKALVN